MSKKLAIREERQDGYVMTRYFLNESGNIEGIYETYCRGLPHIFMEYKNGVIEGVVAKYRDGMLMEIYSKDRYGRMQDVHEVYEKGNVIFSHRYIDGIRVDKIKDKR